MNSNKELITNNLFQIESIRQIDDQTPIIIEPTYWAQSFSLESFDWSKFVRKFENVFLSIHFYEPQKLTFRHKNGGKFEFPGSIPVYNCLYSETDFWDEKMVEQRVEFVQEFGKKKNVRKKMYSIISIGLRSFNEG